MSIPPMPGPPEQDPAEHEQPEFEPTVVESPGSIVVGRPPEHHDGWHVMRIPRWKLMWWRVRNAVDRVRYGPPGKARA